MRTWSVAAIVLAVCLPILAEEAPPLDPQKWSLAVLGNEEQVAARVGYVVQRLPTVTIGFEAIRVDSLAEDDGGYGGGLWATWETPIALDTTRWTFLQGLDSKTYMGGRVAFVDRDGADSQNLVSILAGVTTQMGLGIEYQYAFDQSSNALDVPQHQVMLVVGPLRF